MEKPEVEGGIPIFAFMMLPFRQKIAAILIVIAIIYLVAFFAGDSFFAAPLRWVGLINKEMLATARNRGFMFLFAGAIVWYWPQISMAIGMGNSQSMQNQQMMRQSMQNQQMMGQPMQNMQMMGQPMRQPMRQQIVVPRGMPMQPGMQRY